MDTWNACSFDASLRGALQKHSELIAAYYCEDRRLMDEHLNSEPYESLKPNRYSSEFAILREQIVSPIMNKQRIRVWHYTRLTDDEATAMNEELVLSTLAGLKRRIDELIRQGAFSQEEGDAIYRDSPFQTQERLHSGRLFAVTIPKPADNSGVKPLLASWGGESAYFWLSNIDVAEKLKNIGTPRIAEIETGLTDGLNAYRAADGILSSWARFIGESAELSDFDMAITGCLNEAKVLKIYTLGDGVFETVGRTYPEGCPKNEYE